ncbi:hypothetical protein PoB_007407700 [Plakobranchus ocellatus]|uniref:Serine protease n=1 Tax=Plakobranchus ocellatus TaxID=259542 RepID=A0AAV4DU79_9GAST|nr:hypothetical protein PoB_007407700 [Plakobranchus ocellatus]
MFSDNFVTENHEAELADEEAEGGRPLSEKRCSKYPGHPQFIPIKCFRETHLPPELRDDAGTTYNKILCQAKLTVKIKGCFISKDRPEGLPYFDKKGLFVSINGTGFITNVYNNEEPEYDQLPLIDLLQEPGEGPWSVNIVTSAHVVFDQTEVEACQVILDFDDETAEREGRVVTLKGDTLLDVSEGRDWCKFKCFTQDRDLVRKLWPIVCDFYSPNKGMESIDDLETLCPSDNNFIVSDIDSDDDFPPSVGRVMVSHPHGHSKMVTIGTRVTQTHNNSLCYTYDTPTCPGSSGALVMYSDVGLFSSFIHYGTNGCEPGFNQSSFSVRFPKFRDGLE